MRLTSKEELSSLVGKLRAENERLRAVNAKAQLALEELANINHPGEVVLSQRTVTSVRETLAALGPEPKPVTMTELRVRHPNGFPAEPEARPRAPLAFDEADFDPGPSDEERAARELERLDFWMDVASKQSDDAVTQAVAETWEAAAKVLDYEARVQHGGAQRCAEIGDQSGSQRDAHGAVVLEDAARILRARGVKP